MDNSTKILDLVKILFQKSLLKLAFSLPVAGLAVHSRAQLLQVVGGMKWHILLLATFACKSAQSEYGCEGR